MRCTATAQAIANSSRVQTVTKCRPLARSRVVNHNRSRMNSTSASPSSKICSVPFKQTPEQAMEKMHIHGLIATAEISNMIYAGLLKLFGPGVTAFAKEFGLGDNLRFRDVKAVLYPLWRVDAIIEGTVENDQNGKTGSAWLGISEGYVPGNPFAPLSYLSFAVPPLTDDLPQYDPSKDIKQLGEGFDVVPVPHTVSPVGLLKKVRSIIGRRKVWEGLKLDESKLSESMIAVYPLMFPVYIAEFEHTRGEESRRFTMIMDAHTEDTSGCRVSWPPPPDLVKQGRFTENYYIKPAPFLPITHLLLPPALTPSILSTSPSITSPSAIAQIFLEWMSPKPSSLTSISPSPMADRDIVEAGIDWDDLRIQSWSGEERQQNGQYLLKAMEVHKGIGALENLADISSQLPEGVDPRGTVVSFQPNSKMPSVSRKPMSEIKEQLSRDVEELKIGLDKVKPTWLKEWEQDKDFGKSKER